jgi:N-acetylneuraminic acid mutarotase
MKIKKFYLFLMCLVMAVTITSCSDEDDELVGNWKTLGSFDGLPRGNATGFVIGDAAYICLGYNAKSKALNDVWRTTNGTNSWDSTNIASFPGNARYSATSFVVNGKAYVGLGYDGTTYYKDFWEYDPTTNKWTQIEDFPGGERYYAVGAGVGNKGYVGTGTDGGTDYKDFWSFTPGSTAGSGTWTKLSSYEGSKRNGASLFVIGNTIYLFGGINNASYPTDMQKYDIASDTWTKILDLKNTDLTTDDDEYDNIPRAYAAAFVINGKGYVTLGTKLGFLSSTYEYDPASNLWTQRTAFSKTTRTDAVAFSLSETNKQRGFVMTGSSSSTKLDDIFEFFPTVENNEYDD